MSEGNLKKNHNLSSIISQNYELILQNVPVNLFRRTVFK